MEESLNQSIAKMPVGRVVGNDLSDKVHLGAPVWPLCLALTVSLKGVLKLILLFVLWRASRKTCKFTTCPCPRKSDGLTVQSALSLQRPLRIFRCFVFGSCPSEFPHLVSGRPTVSRCSNRSGAGCLAGWGGIRLSWLPEWLSHLLDVFFSLPLTLLFFLLCC